MNRHRIYFAALLISGPPVYSWKYRSRGTLGILCLNTSILFKNRIIDVRRNHRLLITDSNRVNDSIIRFCGNRTYISKRVWVKRSTVSGSLTRLTIFFKEDLVVFTQSCAENNRSHRFKAVDPFLAFRPLTSYIKHVDRELDRDMLLIVVKIFFIESPLYLAHGKFRLSNTWGFSSSS